MHTDDIIIQHSHVDTDKGLGHISMRESVQRVCMSGVHMMDVDG